MTKYYVDLADSEDGETMALVFIDVETGETPISVLTQSEPMTLEQAQRFFQSVLTCLASARC